MNLPIRGSTSDPDSLGAMTDELDVLDARVIASGLRRGSVAMGASSAQRNIRPTIKRYDAEITTLV